LHIPSAADYPVVNPETSYLSKKKNPETSLINHNQRFNRPNFQEACRVPEN
jgi:hypothetical protein